MGWSLGRRTRRIALAVALLLPANPGAPAPSAPVRTFEITASRYSFDPAQIEVAEGDVVRLVLHSTDTTHGLEIESYGVEVVIPKGGEPVTVEFVASQAGRFPFKCSEYCGSGHRRMRGELVVTGSPQ